MMHLHYADFSFLNCDAEMHSVPASFSEPVPVVAAAFQLGQSKPSQAIGILVRGKGLVPSLSIPYVGRSVAVFGGDGGKLPHGQNIIDNSSGRRLNNGEMWTWNANPSVS